MQFSVSFTSELIAVARDKPIDGVSNNTNHREAWKYFLFPEGKSWIYGVNFCRRLGNPLAGLSLFKFRRERLETCRHHLGAYDERELMLTEMDHG